MVIYTSHGSTHISRIIISLRDIILKITSKQKLMREENMANLKELDGMKYKGGISHSKLSGFLVDSSNFGTPALVRCYFYDGLPDPE